MATMEIGCNIKIALKMSLIDQTRDGARSLCYLAVLDGLFEYEVLMDLDSGLVCLLLLLSRLLKYPPQP